MNIIGHRKIFLSISGILVLAAVVSVLTFGFKPGIDFVGGTMWQIRLATSDKIQATSEIKDFFGKNLGVQNATVFPSDNQSFIIRLDNISETEHQQYLSALQEKFGSIEEIRFEGIGPSIGKELRKRAFQAIALVLLGISLYIAFAFRKVSYPIKSWKYGLITLITLFHDIIVVFDRIRENLLLKHQRFDLENIINDSVNSTIARSINTSFTLVLVLLSLFFLGPITLKYFILTILVGTVIGTYSSIFVASPLLLLWASKK